MPTINRIRIVNFAYNDDKRLFLDDIFEYHGKNGLMNLLNGGGKSVLIQAIMQPFIPLCKLGQRKFEDLFRKDKEPSYILVEWKLDNNNGYMTNGIAIKRNSNSQDDETDKLDYFTFILDGAKCNITDLELSKKENDKISFISYLDLKNKIKISGGITYEKNSDAYKKALNTYNIDTKEWKTVISRINSDEGGLLKLFEECKTSSTLMSDWILKSVSENLKYSANLPQLKNLIEIHINKSREKIEEKEKKKYLREYQENLREANKEVFKLKDLEVKTNAAKTEISNLEYSLNEHTKEKALEIEVNNIDIENIKNRLEEIKIEELSLLYYKKYDRKVELENEKLQLDKMLIDLKEQYKECERLITSYRVADLKKQCLEKEKDLVSFNTKIEKVSKEQDEIDKQINDIGYSINQIYVKIIEELRVEKLNKEESYKINEQELNALKQRQNVLNNENIELANINGELEANIKNTDKDIKDLAKYINPLNMLITVDENEVLKEKENLFKNITSLNEEISDINIKVNDTKTQVSNNINLIENTTKEVGNIQSLLNKNTDKLKQYNIEFLAIKNKLSLFGIENFVVSDKSIAMNLLEVKKAELNISIEENNTKIFHNKEMLDRLSFGGIDSIKKFQEYLNERGLIGILGTEYLKNSIPSEEERNIFIEKNSLLPFAFILDKKSIEYIKNDKPNFYLDKPIIIVERESLLNISITNSNGYTEINEGIGVLSLYNKELVVKTDIEKEKQKLKSENSRLKEEVENWIKQREQIILLNNKLNDFDYDENFENNTTKFIEELKQQVLTKNIYIQSIKEENKGNENIIKTFETNIKTKENELKVLQEKLNMSDKLIENINNKIYLSKKHIDVKKRLQACEIELSEVVNRISRLNDTNLNLNIDKTRLEEKIKSNEKEHKQYSSYNNGEITEDDLEILIEQFNALLSKSDSSNLQEYKAKVIELNNYIRKLKENISIYKDYDTIEYDFLKENKAQIKKDSLNNEITKISSAISVKEENIISLERDIKDVLEELYPKEVRERYLINSNLQEEKSILSKKLNELYDLNTKIEKDIEGCKKIIDRIKDTQILVGFKIENVFNDEYVKLKEKIFEENNIIIKSLSREEESLKEKIKYKIDEVIKENSNKNQSIDISIKKLAQMISRNISTQLFDFIERQIELIDRLLDIIKKELEDLEKSESFIINQCLDIASQYTEEINKIDKNSNITIQNRRLKMMKIKNIKSDESSPINLTNYIKEQIERLTNNIEIKENDLVKAINREFKIENLLTSYCKLNHVVVDFLKIEDNINSSKYRTWEEVIPNNSGGEKFVSFFVLFATLINYERKNHLKKEQVSMCLIMDNPFAAISSKHLLIPLFEYAKKSNIQLICFTDHNKIDIIDRFDVIHKLVIKNLVNNKEFIYSVKIKDDLEIMDEGYYYYNEQISLI